MRRYNLLIAGLFMVGAGAYLIFANPPDLPLWFVAGRSVPVVCGHRSEH